MLRWKFGGARRSRTADLYNAIVALSQLSYGPKGVGLYDRVKNLSRRRVVATNIVQCTVNTCQSALSSD